MPSFGLVVEGKYDVAFFSELIPRICATAEIARAIDAGGSPLLRKFPVYLKAVQHVTPVGPVDRAFVIRDSNGKDPQQVEHEMRTRIAGRVYNFPLGYVLHAVRQKMETWLLADNQAIGAVAGGRPVPPVGGALEDIPDAKERLQRVLSTAGIAYTPAACARIARALDLDVLRGRCPRFVSFEGKVLGGLPEAD